jgi:hypothetical protein
MTPSKSERIAICGEAVFSTSPKHDLLFFDRIGVFELEKKVKLLRERRRRDTNARRDIKAGAANDLEFLESQNYVFSAPLPVFEEAGSNEGYEEEAELIEKMIIEHRISPKGYYQLHDSIQLLCARACARFWQHSTGQEHSAIRSKPLPAEVEQLLGFQRSSANVIDVVLDKLPMPSELTPWEAILDFKADTEAQGYLQGPKVWMADVARQKLPANEARDRLEWLLSQHQKHLKTHKLSYCWGFLGATFVAATDVLGGLGSYGKVAGPVAVGAVVTIAAKKIELMKAELSNPAKEVSYIVKARERFEG